MAKEYMGRVNLSGEGMEFSKGVADKGNRDRNFDLSLMRQGNFLGYIASIGTRTRLKWRSGRSRRQLAAPGTGADEVS
jgi:hypothetical protein